VDEWKPLPTVSSKVMPPPLRMTYPAGVMSFTVLYRRNLNLKAKFESGSSDLTSVAHNPFSETIYFRRYTRFQASILE